jgi:hypothetical protein
MTASWTKMNKNLKNVEKSELIGILGELFAKVPEARDFLLVRFQSDSLKSVLKKYEKLIENEFFPSRGFGKIRIKTVKKAISDYKKITGDPQGTRDLMLVFLEQGIAFFNEYGNISESAIDSMFSTMNTFTNDLSKTANREFISFFKERLLNLQEETKGVGYGLGDEISCQINDLLELIPESKKRS